MPLPLLTLIYSNNHKSTPTTTLMFHRKTKMEAVNGRVEILRKFISYLETYRGRDKTIRLLTYGSYIVSGLSKRIRGGDRDFNVGKLAAELSNLRVMLRLFDDLSMLQYSLSYGIGSIHVSN